MSVIWSNFVLGNLPFHPAFFCVAYQIPLRKRRHWLLFRSLSIVVGLLLLFLQTTTLSLMVERRIFIPDEIYAGLSFAYLPLQFCILMLLFWRSCDISFSDSLYGTACAYANQHMADCLSLLLFPDQVYGSRGGQHPVTHLCSLLISLTVLFVGYFLVAKRMPEDGRYRVDTLHSQISAVLVVGFAMLLSCYAKIIKLTSSTAMFRVCMLFDLLCCVFVLWAQVERQQERRLTREVETERIIRAQQKEQFSMVQAGIERVNRKCHDLKHKIEDIRRISDHAMQQQCLAELEQAVLFYDYMVKSGNEVIDTVLTEKSLICEQEGITWTCMANGPTLDFMENGDLYLLFNGALENAIESVRKLSDPRRRIIALTLHRKRDMAFLQIENYYAEPPVFVDGLPRSTKLEGSVHGYGLKNIRNVVQKYHGTLELSAENGLFLFSALIPLPDAPKKREEPSEFAAAQV